MSISVIVATYGGVEWEMMALKRAQPSIDWQAPAKYVLWHEPDGTIASSRNAAAAQATQDWLCFLDADDELAPGYVAAMEAATTNITYNPLAVPTLFTPRVQQIRNGPPGEPFFYKECPLERCNWLVIGTLISKQLFDEIGGFHEHPHGLEDWNLWARAVRAGATIVKVPDAIYIAHINKASKHRALARDKRAYRAAYELARADAWG